MLSREIKKKTQNYKFRFMEQRDVEQASILVADTFIKYDPFIVLLKVEKEEYTKSIKKELAKLANHKMVMLAEEDITGRIIGVHAGRRFDLCEIVGKPRENFTVDLQKVRTMNYEEKINILDDIDATLLKYYYEMHKEMNDLNDCMFADYFCIASDYFGSSLAKQLAASLFQSMYDRGLGHTYGAFFNPKSFGLIDNLLTMIVINEVKIKFVEGDKEKDFKVVLIHINKEGHKPRF